MPVTYLKNPDDGVVHVEMGLMSRVEATAQWVFDKSQ